LGCEDVVIAASGDGLLVLTKNVSGNMMPFVEKSSVMRCVR
jgi:hypothetical protein